MSSRAKDFNRVRFLGNVLIPRDISPTVRSTNRRTDPDGTSAVPYFPNLAGKSIKIGYTTTGSPIVPVEVLATFASDGLAAIITYLNGLDATNLKASDEDGFLRLTNLNAGAKHVIYTTYAVNPDDANEAYPVLGFDVDSKVVGIAGNLSSSPGNRIQKNPQSTGLLVREDDFTSAAVNRAILAAYFVVDQRLNEADQEVVGVEEVPGFYHVNVSPAFKWVSLDPGLPYPKIPIFFDDAYASNNPSTVVPKMFEITDLNGNKIYNPTTGAQVRPSSAHLVAPLGAPSNVVDRCFNDWNSPDGKSIFGVDSTDSNKPVYKKDKYGPIAITYIRDDVVGIESSPSIIGVGLDPGDHLIIEGSTNDVPFNHDGEYVIIEVIDLGLTDHYEFRVRPLAVNEPAVYTEIRPQGLNPNGISGTFGDARIVVGKTIQARTYDGANGGIGLIVNDAGSALSDGQQVMIRMLAATRYRAWVGTPDETFPMIARAGRSVQGSPQPIMDKLYDHFATVKDAAHLTTNIDTVAADHSLTWADATGFGGSAGDNLSQWLQLLVNTLAANATAAGAGAAKVGAGSITQSPRSLTQSNVYQQLLDLLTYLNAHINDGVAHAGAGATYSGSNNWVDGTNLPSGITIDQAIDKIVDDLRGISTNSGAEKLGTKARTSWANGSSPTNPAGSIYAAIDKIITDLNTTTSGADGATRVAAANTTDLVTGTVRSQLDAIATGWAKLNRANTFSAKQTMNGASGDTNAAMDTTVVPVARKLLWEIRVLTNKVRFYSGDGSRDGFLITYNANWNGSAWAKDTSAAVAVRMFLGGPSQTFEISLQTPNVATFLDSAWTLSPLTVDFQYLTKIAGGLGMVVNALGNPVTPGTDAFSLFATSTGSGGTKRNQLNVKWSNGQTLTIAESEPGVA